MRFIADIHVTLKPAVNDPQGNAVLAGLLSMGFSSVHDVRVGKYLTLAIDASDEEMARTQADKMCDKLLVNPVIETYRLMLRPACVE